MTATTLGQYHAQKPVSQALFVTLELYHPSFGVRRYVRDYIAHTFRIESTAARDAGTDQVFQPLLFSAPRPEQIEGQQSGVTVSIPRVGTDAIQMLRQIDGIGWMLPGEMILREYLEGVTGPQKVYDFAIDSVNLGAGDVSILAADENSANYRVSESYTIERFPGLEDL